MGKYNRLILCHLYTPNIACIIKPTLLVCENARNVFCCFRPLFTAVRIWREKVMLSAVCCIVSTNVLSVCVKTHVLQSLDKSNDGDNWWLSRTCKKNTETFQVSFATRETFIFTNCLPQTQINLRQLLIMLFALNNTNVSLSMESLTLVG